MPVPKVKKSIHWIDRNGEALWAALAGLFYIGLILGVAIASAWLFIGMLCLFVVSVRALNNFTPVSQRRSGIVSYIEIVTYPLMAWRQ